MRRENKNNKGITTILFLLTRILVSVILGLTIYQMIKAINPDNNDNNIFVITQCILLLVYSFIPMIVEKKGNVEISEAMKILFIAFGIDSILIGEIFGAIQLLPGGIK